MALTDAGDGAARQKWSLTRDAFDRLLAALHPERDTAAERYLEVRRNLCACSSGAAVPPPTSTPTRP